MPTSGKGKPKLDRRGQAKDMESFRTLEQAHGRYSASDTREASKRAAVEQRGRKPPRGASRNKPVGA